MLGDETFDFISKIEATREQSQLWRLTAAYLEKFGLTHSIYTVIDSVNPKLSRAWTSLPGDWQQRYADKEYWKTDPFYRYCCRTFQPMSTGIDYVKHYDFLSTEETKIIQEGSESGFRSGFSVPVRLIGAKSIGGWNFGSTLKARELESLRKEFEGDIRLAGFCVHEQLQRLSKVRSITATRPRSLTPRECECLLWLGRGLRTAAIADRLGLAEITVHIHFRAARTKLHSATREEALAKAVMRGLIVP